MCRPFKVWTTSQNLTKLPKSITQMQAIPLSHVFLQSVTSTEGTRKLLRCGRHQRPLIWIPEMIWVIDNATKQGSTSEANGCSGSQELHRILRCSLPCHNSQPLTPILSHMDPVQSISISLRSILILSSNACVGLLSFPTKTLHALLSSPSHLVILDLSTLMFGQKRRSQCN
jgi:hypothetical protein